MHPSRMSLLGCTSIHIDDLVVDYLIRVGCGKPKASDVEFAVWLFDLAGDDATHL